MNNLLVVAAAILVFNSACTPSKKDAINSEISPQESANVEPSTDDQAPVSVEVPETQTERPESTPEAAEEQEPEIEPFYTAPSDLTFIAEGELSEGNTITNQEVTLTWNEIQWAGYEFLGYRILSFGQFDCQGLGIESTNMLAVNTQKLTGLEGNLSFKVMAVFSEEKISISECSANITLDYTIPEATIDYSGMALRTNTVTFDISYEGSDDIDMVRQVLDETCNAVKEFEPATGTLAVEIPNEEGAHTVWVQYKDQAGNLSLCSALPVVFDSTAPTDGSILINNGESDTETNNVTLSLTATDPTPGTEMTITQGSCLLLSNPEIDWIPYLETVPFALNIEEGTASTEIVSVRFRDDLGNATECYQDSIEYSPLPAPTPLTNADLLEMNTVVITAVLSGDAGVYYSDIGRQATTTSADLDVSEGTMITASAPLIVKNGQRIVFCNHTSSDGPFRAHAGNGAPFTGHWPGGMNLAPGTCAIDTNLISDINTLVTGAGNTPGNNFYNHNGITSNSAIFVQAIQ